MWVALEWVERHCIVPDGFNKGRPFRLYEYQGEYYRNFYLVRGDAPWIPSAPVLSPAFVFSRALLVGPQGLGKNPLIATQVCLEGVGPALFAGFAGPDEGYVCSEHGCGCGWEYAYDVGEPRGMSWPTPLIQITAFSLESTDNTYDALRPMIDDGPLTHLIPKTGEEFIRLPGGGRIDTVTSSNQSRLGNRATYVPQDEVGIWLPSNKMDKLANTQYRSLSKMGGRAALTTNPWDPSQQSVAQREYESSEPGIHRQFLQPPATLSYANKRERRKIHRIVYPADTRRENGGHVDLDSIEAEAAKVFERDPAEAQRFYGNRLVPGAGHAVDPAVWDDLERPNGAPPKGTEIGLGFAGGRLRGCTRTGYTFSLGPEEPATREDSLAAVNAAYATYRVGRQFSDPRNWLTEVEGWQASRGKDVNKKPIALALDYDRPLLWAPAVDRWLTAIRLRAHTHDGDPATSAQVKSAQKRKVHLAEVETDRTMYLLRGSDRSPIHDAVADVLAFEAAMTMAETPPAPKPRITVLTY